jgi:hypothetical protein
VLLGCFQKNNLDHDSNCSYVLFRCSSTKHSLSQNRNTVIRHHVFTSFSSGRWRLGWFSCTNVLWDCSLSTIYGQHSHPKDSHFLSSLSQKEPQSKISRPHTSFSYIVQFMTFEMGGSAGTKRHWSCRKFDTVEHFEQGERSYWPYCFFHPSLIPNDSLLSSPQPDLVVYRWLCASILLIRQPAKTCCSINCLTSRWSEGKGRVRVTKWITHVPHT